MSEISDRIMRFDPLADDEPGLCSRFKRFSQAEAVEHFIEYPGIDGSVVIPGLLPKGERPSIA